MARKKRTQLLLTDPAVKATISRLTSSLSLRAAPPPWEGGPTPDVDLEGLREAYERQHRRFAVAFRSGDSGAAAVIALLEADPGLRDAARAEVDARRAYWQRRKREVPAVDPALLAGER